MYLRVYADSKAQIRLFARAIGKRPLLSAYMVIVSTNIKGLDETAHAQEDPNLDISHVLEDAFLLDEAQLTWSVLVVMGHKSFAWQKDNGPKPWVRVQKHVTTEIGYMYMHMSVH